MLKKAGDMFTVCCHYTFRLFKHMHRINKKNKLFTEFGGFFIHDTLYCTIVVSARDRYLQLFCTSGSRTRCIHLSKGKCLTMNISNFTGMPLRFI